MAKAIFVSPKYIKQKSIVSGNVDPDKMIQFIETAQDIHVQNYLGSNLYIKLQNIVDDGTIDDLGNEAYRTLLTDFIKPMLAWYTQAEYIPFSAFMIADGGVFKHNSENSFNASSQEITRLAKLANDKAQFYTNRLIEHLRDNESDYSEYTAFNDDMNPEKDVNTTTWYLG